MLAQSTDFAPLVLFFLLVLILDELAKTGWLWKAEKPSPSPRKTVLRPSSFTGKPRMFDAAKRRSSRRIRVNDRAQSFHVRQPRFSRETTKLAWQQLELSFSNGMPLPQIDEEEEEEDDNDPVQVHSEQDLNRELRRVKMLRRRTTSKIDLQCIELMPLLEYNRRWAKEQVAKDPLYFQKHAETQRPDYLWIGCSDSRVAANIICGLQPGELFVHRNVANIVHLDDANACSVIKYAVEHLGVRHIVVCGHYGCGGVRACIGPEMEEPIESWIKPLRELASESKNKLDELEDDERRWRYLCEENVKANVLRLEQMACVREAWERSEALALHGFIYDVADGRLNDLRVSVNVPEPEA